MAPIFEAVVWKQWYMVGCTLALLSPSDCCYVDTCIPALGKLKVTSTQPGDPPAPAFLLSGGIFHARGKLGSVHPFFHLPQGEEVLSSAQLCGNDSVMLANSLQ